MIDPSLPLQGALITTLKADVGVKAIFGSPARVYDRVPTTNGVVPAALFPFASLGPVQVINDGNACGDQAEVYAVLDVWSQAIGYPEVRQCVAAICAVLTTTLTVPGFRVVIQDIEDINYRREPDGLTSRAIIGLRFNLVPTP
jgi:uncharacterized protein DUF3168